MNSGINQEFGVNENYRALCAKRIREISKEIRESKLVKLNKERIGLEDELM